MTKTLDLGCADRPRNPFDADEVYGIDIADVGLDNVVVADLVVDAIPFDDNEFDYVSAYDFIEHIPRLIYISGERKYPFIDLMSEIWRVLKPGGKFLSHTPYYPKAPAFRDPTHVNFITDETFKQYFCGTYKRVANIYGFKGIFKMVSQEKGPVYLDEVLEAIKE